MALDFYHTSDTQTHVKRSSGVYEPCHNSHSETVASRLSSQNDKASNREQERRKEKKKAYKSLQKLVLKLNDLMVFNITILWSLGLPTLSREFLRHGKQADPDRVEMGQTRQNTYVYQAGVLTGSTDVNQAKWL